VYIVAKSCLVVKRSFGTVAFAIVGCVNVLEQTFFLCCEFVFVCFAWVAAQVAVGITAVHGMVFGQSVWLFDSRIMRCKTVLFRDLELLFDSVVIFEQTPRVFDFVFVFTHILI
jgi:hypothetical protein